MASSLTIPLSKPDITRAEKSAVLGVLNTPNLSLGPKLAEFEKMLAQRAQRRYAVAVNSGTSALHLIVRALGINKGDEVITTPFSFIASANCVLYEGARPVFADIDEKSLNIDPAEIEKKITRRTKAILAVDVFGQPADWDAILRIAAKHKLKVIEDSAEAIGAVYKGRRCGSFGDASVFSFYPNKQMTTGEGGAVMTDDKKTADACRSMTNQGRKVEEGSWLDHVQLGYNYRIPEISCALGIEQLKRLDVILRRREAVARLYTETLKGVLPPAQIPRTKRSWFVYVIQLPEGYTKAKRDALIQSLAQKGIQSRPYFVPIHLQPFYKKSFGYRPGMFKVTESVGARALALPFFTSMKASEVKYVVAQLAKLI